VPTEDEILARCTNVLPGHGTSDAMKDVFQGLADALEGDETLDSYASGAYIDAFEAEIAAMFGKEAGVFMPSGTMAQQIALRIWCDRRHNPTVAMHPTAHPEWAEHQGYRYLHHLQRLQFGAPEFLADRMLTVADFEALAHEPGAILLELPYRPLGGQLPAWEELRDIRAWAAERGIPLHLDGARIWQCRPFYRHDDYRPVADLFDSIYVSFYKDLGGLSGAMLLGPAAFVREARVWRVRHGGRLNSMAPFVVSAKMGLERVLPQIDGWVEKTRAVAAIFSEYQQISIRPDPPHTNMFELYIRGDWKALNARHLELAEETGTYLFWGLKSAPVPGVATAEIHCWENAARFDLAALRPLVDRLLES
jgi:threonine aldolase